MVNCEMLINGYNNKIYTDFIGNPEKETYNKMVPGDLVIMDGHVAIVNYITGERGVREMTDIRLIQAIGGPDKYPKWGKVNSLWTWGDNNFNGIKYHARRLRP